MSALRKAAVFGAMIFAFCTGGARASSLVAHWRMDEENPPFSNSTLTNNPLNHDPATTAPMPVNGRQGGASYLDFRTASGISTRLHAAGAGLQTDSFGFSFWISPVDMHPGDNLLAKEMAVTGGANFTRMAWQVQVGQDNGSGASPLEFVVRGDDRSAGDFSAACFPPSRCRFRPAETAGFTSPAAMTRGADASACL